MRGTLGSRAHKCARSSATVAELTERVVPDFAATAALGDEIGAVPHGAVQRLGQAPTCHFGVVAAAQNVGRLVTRREADALIAARF